MMKEKCEEDAGGDDLAEERCEFCYKNCKHNEESELCKPKTSKPPQLPEV